MQTNDPRIEYGVDLSNGEPVAKTEVQGRCGNFSLAIQNSTSVSNESGFGGRQTANETTARIGYRNDIDLPLV
ncbi:MAG: hypothetical protein AAB901_01580, partial [Patescibacteria group bacterium]